jgi:site-specific DNA-methyltransferase (adenine-specific)
VEITILEGDCRDVLPTLPADSFAAIVTSPPYWSLLDYDTGAGEIGGELTPSIYVETIVGMLREARRTLRADGICWVVIGDTYASARASRRRNRIGNLSLDVSRPGARPNRLVEGLKEGDLAGIPARLALALRDDGWYWRAEIVWAKPTPPPEGHAQHSRPTRAHETILMLAKSRRYSYRSLSGISTVWTIATQPGAEGHPAPFPPALVRRCLDLSPDGAILDPFAGSGTVGLVAAAAERPATLIELNPRYVAIATRRQPPMLVDVRLRRTTAG